MSRIGRKPIPIPEGVKVKLEGNEIEIEGPKGKLKREVHPLISVKIEENQIKLEPKKMVKGVKALWGTERALIANMVEGVTQGFEKQLEIEGTGYGVKAQGKKLIFSLGFSHPVEFEVPEDVSVEVEGTTKIKVFGIDKQRVGEIAAQIRRLKPPEPYKGKGIRYVGEEIRRKASKKAVGK
ncbi:50S ribosomal protein L6 [bacterium]|nr:50S ribosomal protein L6 [bacterium]